jgi:hypothetical protein
LQITVMLINMLCCFLVFHHFNHPTHTEPEHFKCPHKTSVFKTPLLLSVVEMSVKMAENSIMNCRCYWSVDTQTASCTFCSSIDLLTSDMRYRYCRVLSRKTGRLANVHFL